jgi:tetratricopeptide (TPR) repeat protein
MPAEYARAEALVREHQWDAGIAVLQPLLERRPLDIKVLNLAGLAFIGKGNSAEGIKYFEAALKEAPNFTPALKNLAIAEAALGHTSSAEKHLQTALRQTPEDPILNLYLGEIQYQEEDFHSAVEHFRKGRPLIERNPTMLADFAISDLRIGDQQEGLTSLIALDPQQLGQPAATTLGVELAKADLCAQAIPYLLRAQTLSQHEPAIGYDLGVCQLSLKQYSEAARTFQTLIDDKYETSEIDRAIADAYEGKQETQKAVDALRRAIALNPSDENGYLAFASLCLDHQDFKGAERVISVGLSRQPKSSSLVFERGILNAMQDHFDDAEADFQMSANLAPESNTGYIGLGVTYLETGKAAQAVPVLRSRLQDHPDDANLNYLYAEALLRAGAQPGEPAYLEAQNRLQKSITIDPKLVEPHVSLGKIYLNENRVNDAVHQFELARSIDPNSKAACAHLAVGYRKLGQSEKARAILLELRAINDQERTGSRVESRAPGQTAETNAHSPS